jgi:hypothetical protein
MTSTSGATSRTNRSANSRSTVLVVGISGKPALCLFQLKPPIVVQTGGLRKINSHYSQNRTRNSKTSQKRCGGRCLKCGYGRTRSVVQS